MRFKTITREFLRRLDHVVDSRARLKVAQLLAVLRRRGRL
jgi:hypothetical protein